MAKRKSPLLVFGSVLPDVSWTSKNEIGRDQIHYAPRELYKFISEKYPHLIDLAIGVKLHNNIDKGADFYSDDTEIGFAKVEGRKIEREAATLLGEEKSEKSLVLAHNFVEASVDLLVNESNPEILELYRKSIGEINFDEISACLADYLRKDKSVIAGEIERFLDFVGPDAYSSRDNMIDRMLLLVKQRRGKDVDRAATESELSIAVDLMRNKYQSYLDGAVEGIKRDFSALL